MHFYVLNKYTDMKSTWLLCFYAFIAQKLFTTRNFFLPEAPNTSRMRSWQFPSLIFLDWQWFLYTFFNVSDQIWRENDQIEMKSHSKYDYECIRNSLSTYPLLSSKQWLTIDPTWPAVKVNNAHGFEFISWSVWILILLFILFNLHRFN